MIIYIVLAEMCKTIGMSTWVVKLCWVGFALRSLDIVADIINYKLKEGRKCQD
jgi:hypothetical protein